ncbi:MAG: disulfide bond formation protein B [Candidatus Doudnabacteria bacterium]
MKKLLKKYALYGAWAQSLMGMLGSLYFSEIANFPPCILCWYQRIAMYPLVVILAFAIYTKDKLMLLPALVLATAGWVVSLYQNLLYYDIIPEETAPCTLGVSCTSQFVKVLGFIDIPLMALIGFSVILGLLIYAWLDKSSDQDSRE